MCFEEITLLQAIELPISALFVCIIPLGLPETPALYIKTAGLLIDMKFDRVEKVVDEIKSLKFNSSFIAAFLKKTILPLVLNDKKSRSQSAVIL